MMMKALIPPLEHAVDDIDGRDSDDETYDPANPDLEEYVYYM